MANIAQFSKDGVSYTYDMESRSPLADKNVKKAVEGELVYDKETKAPTEVKENERIVARNRELLGLSDESTNQQ